MRRRIEPLDISNRSPSRGRCFVYVLPCAYEDILKLGFSRDPVERMQALHHRYFEFFDLDRAFLIETETVRDARRLELQLGAAIALHNAPSPLVVCREAAGHTEWYRGAHGLLRAAAMELSATGFRMHEPLRPWLRAQLLARSGELFDWAQHMLMAIESATEAEEILLAIRQALRDALDAYEALDIDPEPWVSAAVLRWHRAAR